MNVNTLKLYFRKYFCFINVSINNDLLNLNSLDAAARAVLDDDDQLIEERVYQRRGCLLCDAHFARSTAPRYKRDCGTAARHPHPAWSE